MLTVALHVKLITYVQVFTGEFGRVLARSQNTVDLGLRPMGLRSLGVEMRPRVLRIASTPPTHSTPMLWSSAALSAAAEQRACTPLSPSQ